MHSRSQLRGVQLNALTIVGRPYARHRARARWIVAVCEYSAFMSSCNREMPDRTAPTPTEGSLNDTVRGVRVNDPVMNDMIEMNRGVTTTTPCAHVEKSIAGARAHCDI
jgi:hypothetical protein